MPKIIRKEAVRASLVCLVFIGGQIGVTLLQTEFFPFSDFSMYSSRLDSRNFHLVRLYLVDEHGQREPYFRALRGVHSEFYFMERIKNAYYVEQSDASVLKEVRAMLDESKKLAPERLQQHEQQSGLKMRSVLVVSEFWKRFTGPQRNNPDTTRIIGEVPL